MSIHKSLFIGGAQAKERSVWTRRERLEVLMREGRWDPEAEEGSVFGLPKVRTRWKVLSRKQRKARAALEAAAKEAEGGAGKPAGD